MTATAPQAPQTPFTPSPYQQAIFAFVRDGSGNGIVAAVAGAGKTSTLVQAAKLLTADGIFLAFNKHIAEELQRRLTGTKLTAKTIHSVGMAALSSHLGRGPRVDPRKYQKLVRADLWEHEDAFLDAIAEGDTAKLYEARTIKEQHKQTAEKVFVALLDKVRVTRTDASDADALLTMVEHFTLECPAHLLRIAPTILPRILAAGERQAAEEKVIDFTDMLCLPVAWNVPLPIFRWVFVDECQDLSAAQLDLVLRLRAEDGRVLAVGDENQSIMGFAGADAASFARIKAATNATELPLSICYRCPRSVIALAQELVPHIEARPGAPQGTVREIANSQFAEEVRVGDMVLCRLTAPLIAECIRLIQRHVPARVRGRDIGKQLTDLAQAVALMPSYGGYATFGETLEDYRATQERKLASREGAEGLIEALHDRADAVRVCWESFNAPTLDRLCAEIDTLFSDEQEGVLLSTVHRAKGLECPRVYILKPDKLPLVWPKQQPWEAEQELHIKYVALTRATDTLTFVRDFGF